MTDIGDLGEGGKIRFFSNGPSRATDNADGALGNFLKIGKR
jgi:hypothetical protein